MNMPQRLLTSFFLIFNLSSFGGQIYSWHPQTVLHLGAGFDPHDLTQSKTLSVQSDGVERIDTQTGAIDTTFSSGEIHDQREFLSTLKVDLDTSAHYTLYSGGFDAHNLQRIHFSSDSLTWYLQAKCDYGRFQLKNPRLTKDAKRMTKHQEQFGKAFGTHFIATERRAAMVTAVFTLNNVSQEKAISIRAAMNGAMSSPMVGGKLNASYEQLFSEALKLSAIQFSFYARGGSGMSTLSGVVTNITQLSSIRADIADYLSHVNESNAPAVEYYPQLMSTLDNDLNFEELPGLYDRVVEAYYTDYLACEERLIPLTKLANSTPGQNCWILTNQFANYKAAKEAYSSIEVKLLNEAQQLKKKAGKLMLPSVEFPDAPLPNPRIVQLPTVPGQSGIFGYVEGGNFEAIHLFRGDEHVFLTPLLPWTDFVKACGTQFAHDADQLKFFLGENHLNDNNRRYFVINYFRIRDEDVPRSTIKVLNCENEPVVTQELLHF